MALGRTYTIDSGAIGIATSTNAQAIIAGITTTTNVCDIEAIRVGVYSATGATASYSSNGTLLCQLARIASPGSYATTATARPHNQADLAANTTWSTGTFATGSNAYTPTAILWGQSIPLTAGANWAEWVTPGAEWRIGPSSSVAAAAYVALIVTASITGTSIDLVAEIVFSE
jgi:hypothetical protein